MKFQETRSSDRKAARNLPGVAGVVGLSDAGVGDAGVLVAVEPEGRGTQVGPQRSHSTPASTPVGDKTLVNQTVLLIRYKPSLVT